MEKTLFVTQGELYKFKVMTFRLVNAPATFERLMERVLRGIVWWKCLIYLDDILVFGPDFANTLKRLTGGGGAKVKAEKVPVPGPHHLAERHRSGSIQMRTSKGLAGAEGSTQHQVVPCSVLLLSRASQSWQHRYMN